MPISVKIFESIFNLNSASNSCINDSSYCNQFSIDFYNHSDLAKIEKFNIWGFWQVFTILNWTVNEILSEQSFKKSRSQLTSRLWLSNVKNEWKWLEFDIGDALLLNSYRPNPMSQSFFTLSSLEDTFELPILRQPSQNLEEIVLRLTEALGLWGYDKVFIYDKWLERGKKVRRYHRTLFFNLFSRGQTAPHGYKQILILWNIKYTHVPQKHRPWLNHSTCEIRIDPCYQSLTEISKRNYMLF